MRCSNRVLSVFLTTLILLAAVLFSVPAFAAGTVVSRTVDGVNQSRGTDQLIIYNEGETTGTNEWGYEVSVDADGVVRSVGGNNSVIPTGGFVVSGHGASMSWLKSHTIKGMYAFYNPYSKQVLFSSEPIDPSYTYSIPLSGINKQRGADELILFDRNWGTSTRTNEWGFEVCVSGEGRVLSVGGNNQSIPDGGFVLSAHGKSIKSLVEMLRDEYVVLSADGKSVSVTYDGRTALSKVQDTVDELNRQSVQRKKEGMMGDYVRASSLLAEAGQILNNTDLSDSSACFASQSAVDHLATEIRHCLSESVAGEYRGVWVRPAETNPAQVTERVQKLYENGVNMIALEVFFSGEVVYPVESGCPIPQMGKFAGFDVLQCYIDECHKRQMELHAWHPNVYASSSPNVGIAASHPDWLLKNDKGGTACPTEYGDMYFINPFNKDAVAALLVQYRYLFTHYDIDAFQLDYIRFPGQGSGLDWGYNADIVSAFRKKYGVTPEHSTTASYWKNWCQFRADGVTAFVRSIRDLANKLRPDMLLTADVFGGIDSALYDIYQDYATWMKEGLVDMIHPMLYTTDNASYENDIRAIIGKGFPTPVAPGLGSYVDGYTPAHAMDQILIARKYGCVGTVHFQAIPYLSRGISVLLNASVYRGASYLPWSDSLRACENAVDLLLRRASTVLTETGLVGAADRENLQKAGNAVKLSFSAPAPSSEELKKAVEKLPSAEAAAILSRDLTRLSFLMTFLRPGGTEQDVLVPRGSTVREFASSEGVPDIRLRNGFPASPSDPVGTGMYAWKNGIRRAAVVLGDLNGDGVISAVDYLLCKRHVLGTGLLSGPFLKAARISGNDDVSAVDYLKIKKHVLLLGELPLM